MKVILTGTSGFVGQNLSHYFHGKTMETVALDLRSSSWKQSIPKEADALIHLAGKAHDTTNSAVDKDYFLINTKLTIEVFEAWLQMEIRDFIYFSSVKAVADTTEGILTEDTKPNPLTAYGQSKLQAEEYLLSQSIPSGRRLFIFRPCMIHGPNNKGNFNLLYKIIKKGFPWPLGAYENKRSFLGIDNLSFIINEVISNINIKSGVYNLADDEAISTNELIHLIAHSLGRKSRIWKVSPALINSFCKFGNVFKLPLNSERLKKLTESYVVDNTKIKKAIAKPLPVDSGKGC